MQSKRSFSKTVCILANSRQGDLTGSKIMKKLRGVSGEDLTFTGYGGNWMKKEGL
jgi:lipid A disaccharide synthetase